MNLGKKLTTLLKAAIRGPRAAKQKGASYDDDPATQLESLRQAMSDVETKERQVADLLKAAKTKAKLAEERGNHSEVSAQNRLIAELETHLERQSAQAIALDNKLQQAEAALDAPPPAADRQAAPSDDLDARKSRLSG
jgi:predicted RNase H-like nuclease (RuvC/YqgF family)